MADIFTGGEAMLKAEPPASGRFTDMGWGFALAKDLAGLSVLCQISEATEGANLDVGLLLSVSEVLESKEQVFSERMLSSLRTTPKLRAVVACCEKFVAVHEIKLQEAKEATAPPSAEFL